MMSLVKSVYFVKPISFASWGADLSQEAVARMLDVSNEDVSQVPLNPALGAVDLLPSSHRNLILDMKSLYR
jgi:hypothetical protein